MIYKNAKQLHNGDEVILKSTGEIAVVKNMRKVEIVKSIMLDLCIGNQWIPNIPHTQVK